ERSCRPSRGRSTGDRSTTSSRSSSASVPPPPDVRLVVMARYPVPGRVKTRLARTLGAELACRLYRAFILDLADRLRALPSDVTWAYEPAGAPFAAFLPGARCRPQEGDDLGQRMERAIAAEFRAGGGPVLVIGADVPHLPTSSLEEAVASLARDVDVVL